MATPLHPSLYQINTRVWLTALAQALGRPATLDDIPDDELDRLAARGFDWIWLSTTATAATFTIADCTWTRHRGRPWCSHSSRSRQKPEAVTVITRVHNSAGSLPFLCT